MYGVVNKTSLMMSLAQSIGIEFVFSDQYNTRRRLFLSSSFTEAKETPLLARVPLEIPVRDAWVNLCLDLPDLVAGYFQGQAYHSLESITISAWCSLRRVFTLKVPPPNDEDDAERHYAPIPKEVDIEGSVTQLILKPYEDDGFHGAIPHNPPDCCPVASHN